MNPRDFLRRHVFPLAGLAVAAAPAAALPQITQILGPAGDGAGNTLVDSTGIAVDSLGNAFVTSQGNSKVFKVAPNGTVTVVADGAGDGTHPLTQVAGIAVGGNDDVFVAGIDSNNVFRITPSGAVELVVDVAGDGAGGGLNHPTSLAVDAVGNLYVAGFYSDNVLKCTPGGVITEIVGPAGDGAGNGLDGAFGVAVDPQGNVFVSGFFSSNLLRISPGGVVTEILDATGDGLGNTYLNPYGIAVDGAGVVYATDRNSVFRVDPGGAVTHVLGASGDGTHPMDFAETVAVGSAGRVYVSASGTSNVFEISASGVEQIIDAAGDGAGHVLTEATGLAVDATGTVYVTGYGSRNAFRIERPAPLEPLIYEGFDYPVAASVVGRSGGSNLSGNWLQATSNGSFVVGSGSLDASDLQTSGAHAELTTQGGNYGDARLYDAAAFQTLVDGGEIWMSFVFELGPNGNLNINPFAASGSINQVVRLQVLPPGRVFAHLVSGDNNEVGTFGPGEPTLLVARFVVTGPDNDGQNDTMQVWINPTPGAPLPDVPTALDVMFTFRVLSYAGFTYITEAGGSGFHAMDEWRMGPSYAAVTPVRTDSPPTAVAGSSFSVGEGQLGVVLDGGASFDVDGDALAFSWTQVAGAPVALFDAATAQASFEAPPVAPGGETLTFELTVTANGESDSDTVDVTVVNLNHPPVADAGDDVTVAEGSAITLDGTSSFDVDQDAFSYSWMQVGGEVAVVLNDANTPQPSFVAPVLGGGGEPGVVATLEFQLVVDDGYPLDLPAPGYTFDDSIDTVVVEVTNVNNDPIAAAGASQTVDENTFVALDGAASVDPDGDPLAYSWIQVSGPTVALTGAQTVSPTFQAPFVGAGGDDLVFELQVEDGYGGVAVDQALVHVVNANDPPYVEGAEPTIATIWPPNHSLVSVGIVGVSDPDNNATITIDAVTQDEPTDGTGSGDTPIDAVIQGDGTVLLRAERDGGGDGRVYRVHFTASDLEGSVTGTVLVTVPKSRKQAAIEGSAVHDSTH